MEVSKELFEQFVFWLKQDGLRPRKSERLWKKTIFSRLMNNDKKTIENWEDFMVDFNLKPKKEVQFQDFDENCLIGIGISINSVFKTIRNVIKSETMSRIFFEEGGDVDVLNIELIHILAIRNKEGNEHAK
jgi:hypothetical protein